MPRHLPTRRRGVVSLLLGGLVAGLGLVTLRAGDTATIEGRVTLPVRGTEEPASFNGRYARAAGAAAATLPPPRLLPSGDSAITVEFSRTIDDVANRRAFTWRAVFRLTRAPPAG